MIQIGGVCTTFCQIEGILLQKYRDRNGRCIAILLQKYQGQGSVSLFLFWFLRGKILKQISSQLEKLSRLLPLFLPFS